MRVPRETRDLLADTPGGQARAEIVAARLAVDQRLVEVRPRSGVRR